MQGLALPGLAPAICCILRSDHRARTEDKLTAANLDAIDLLIDARWVIPVDPAASVLEHHSVAVHDGRILQVLPWTQAHAVYRARTVVSLPTHALIPGLVNVHTHASMKLLHRQARPLRAAADGWGLAQAAAKHSSPQLTYDGTLLACAEMLRGGITCFGGVDYFPAESARAAVDLGMRAGLNLMVDEAPTAYAADADDYLAKGLELRDAQRDHPLLSFGIAPQNPCSLGDRTLARVLTLAEELDLPVLMQLHESRNAVDSCVARHGVRPLQRMQRLGLVGPNLIALRANHLAPDEIAMLAQNGSAVVLCPTADMQEDATLPPLARMLSEGLSAGLGADALAGYGRTDVLQEMRLAALLANPADRAPFPPLRFLAMATLEGARALRLDHRVGSIEAGKFADLTAIELKAPDMLCSHDPVTQIIHCAGREHVSHVWVAGRLLLDQRELKIDPKNDMENLLVLWQNRVSMETKA